VIHLRTPDDGNGYGHQNPLRTETATEAAEIDRRILAAWDGHPRRYLVEPTSSFLAKAWHAIEIIRAEIPRCCREGGDYATVSPATTRTGQLAPCTTEPTTLPSSAGIARPIP
jgi:hypothetical protein